MNDIDFVFAEPARIVQRLQEQVRRRFEEERDRILSQVPPSIAKCFQETGFVDEQPTLAVSPFAVPPGPLRQAWMTTFLQLKKEKRLKDLPLLVYHYGPQEESYSLVRASKWIPYKEGKKRGYDQPPRHIQDKLILGQELNEQDKLALMPLRKLKRDQAKNPADRTGGFPNPFLECYDLLTDSPTPKKELDVKIGSHVAVYWEGENDWYEAEVLDIRHDFYFLRYKCDDDEEWLPLAEYPFRILNVPQETQAFRCVSTDPEEAEGEKRVASFERRAPASAERPQSRKASSVETHSNSQESSSQASTYLQERVLNDGCIPPKKKPRQLSNGTYARPAGRQPQHTSWDSQKGIWVPTDRGTKEASSQSLMVEQKRKLAQPPSSPLKKRKIKEESAFARLKSESLHDYISAEADRKVPTAEKKQAKRNLLSPKKGKVASSPTEMKQTRKDKSASARLKAAPAIDSSLSNSAEVDYKVPAAEKKQMRQNSSSPPKQERAVSSPIEATKQARRSSIGPKERSILQGAKTDAKKAFEKMRDETLAAIPANIKSMFGQIGFAKWRKIPLPVLVLSPFDVPPGLVRDRWFEMFKRYKSEGALDQMNYLVYWYGQQRPNDYYSFVQQKQFIFYETGLKKGYHEIPSKIQVKIDDEWHLTEMEEMRVRRIEEMQEDLDKSPADRKRGVVVFPEGYELLSEQDLEDIVENQDESTVEGAAANAEKSAQAVAEAVFQTSPKRSNNIHGKKYPLVGFVGEMEDIGDIDGSSTDEQHETEVVSSEEEVYI